MAKVYGVHLVRLHMGANTEEFERFAAEAIPKLPLYEGWTLSLLKGERGDRVGQYLLLFEIESVEARDRVAPPPGHFTEEAEQFMQEHAAAFETFFEEWARYSPTRPGENSIFTDYVVVGE